MKRIAKDRPAEYSLGIGIISGSLFGFLVGIYWVGEAAVGTVIGAGIGLLVAAFYCGLSRKNHTHNDIGE